MRYVWGQVAGRGAESRVCDNLDYHNHHRGHNTTVLHNIPVNNILHTRPRHHRGGAGLRDVRAGGEERRRRAYEQQRSQ